MHDLSRIALEVLGSITTAGVIILALAGWLGKVWASRILEQDKAKYNREMEELKNKLNKELESYKSQIDLAKLVLSRYSENQFNLYNKLWSSLCDLKIAGNMLWNKADVENLLDFTDRLRKTKEEVIKGALLIEDSHYKQLIELLDKFSNYAVGKYQLIEIDKTNKIDLSTALARSSIVADNASTKDAYEKLLNLILSYFKDQLRG